MTPSLTRSRLYLFPLTSKTQLTLGVVVRVLSPIGNGFVQPAILILGPNGHHLIICFVNTSGTGADLLPTLNP